jgi:sterol 3beta-glucosyltransferase
MRVLIVGIGSRGDVAPYVGLGRRLDEAGCEVGVATHDTFAEMVSEAGLEWRSVSGDPRQVIRARTQGAPSEGRTATRDFVSSMGHDIADAAELGTDVILTCLGQTPLSLLVAESLGVPSMGVYLAPAVPTREFPMPGQPPDDAPDPDHRTAGRQMLARGRTVYADVLPPLTRRLRLPADSVDRVWDRWLGDSGWPISLGYSPAVVPRPDDWSESVEVAGYWWPRPPRTGGPVRHSSTSSRPAHRRS